MQTPAEKVTHSHRDRAELGPAARDMFGRPLPAPSADRKGAAKYPEESQGATLRAVLRVLHRRWLIVAVCTLGVASFALALAVTRESKYESSATLLFRPTALEGPPTPSSKTEAERDAATNVKLGAVDIVAERTAERLNTPGVSGSVVASKVDLAQSNSNVASVTATTTDPELSRSMANAFAEEYIVFRRKLDRASVRDAQAIVARRLERLTPHERPSSEGQRLRRKAQQLQELAALRTGSAELVQRARASGKVSPRPKRDAAIGIILGLLLGIAVAFPLEILDRRLNDDADVGALGLPVLARIPRKRAISRAGSRAQRGLSSQQAEAYRMLRVNLRYLDVDQDVRSLLVTSAARGEGTSVVSWNLALAEAQAGRDVLLIEADLRGGGLAKRLKLSGESGLSLLLAGSASFDKCTARVTTAAGRLDVVPAGPTPSHPAELLESAQMTSLLESAEARYDLVVVDTPPVSALADAVPLIGQVSGVILVACLGRSTRDLAEELRDRLHQLGAPVLGVVVNRTRPAR